MTYQAFQITDVNPNDNMGGGGCICSPHKQIDCKGPYAVFYANDMESVASPHVVVGAGCAAAVFKSLHESPFVVDADVVTDGTDETPI